MDTSSKTIIFVKTQLLVLTVQLLNKVQVKLYSILKIQIVIQHFAVGLFFWIGFPAITTREVFYQ